MALTKNAARKGFTLVELIVVMGILALLATLIVPKIMDMYDRSRSSAQAYSLADIDRHVNTYYALNHKYPEGWDSLLAAGADPQTEPTAIYSKLASVLTATPNGFLQPAPVVLTAEQIASLNRAGLSHTFAHSTATTVEVNFSGVERHHLGTGVGHDGTANVSRAVAIDTTPGSKGYNLLVNDFGLGANVDAAVVPARITTHTYVVLGLGFKNTLVQSQIQEAPVFENAASPSSYGRALVVLEVPNSGSEKALLVGVFGPDGRAKREAMSDYANVNGEQPH